ncbi:DUF11 domain-containing protein [Nonomuraea phyllanthi]|uniref:DUF11 domain-containing protein n=1 Tax=Nonomuraea phyllanthi TaxID=2219224 RepID=UPI0012935456|nr:DUF11 domain-containing protein [Nonomuraea phyllanthi]QFY07544.1 DUF11 domain-containing protein [Nonomuraea phyllanthi]
MSTLRGTPAVVARALTVTLLLLAGVALVGVTPARADTHEVTVSLYRVVELSCNEGDGEACGNDYYPKFNIDNQGLYDGSDDYCCAHGADFTTNWVHKATVDESHNQIDIHLELWDQDDLSQDDVIHWTKNGDYLDLKFDLFRCVFTGGDLTTQQGANLPTLAGESTGSGADSARAYFTITTPHCLELVNETDTDGDGIMNGWETPTGGLDVNSDGTIDVALGQAPYNALPYRKDLFVEADFMKGFKPQAGVLDDVVKAFAAAPVDPDPGSPGGFRGVNLHAMEGEELPSVHDLLFDSDGGGVQDDFNDLKHGNPQITQPGACSGFFGTDADRKSQNCVNILEAKRQVFRYMIFGDTYAEDSGSSGRAEWDKVGPKGGNDFMVTLGGFDETTIARSGGQRNAEAATFMHELGHTLSLGHGGDDDVNCKPNYLSVMNHSLQLTRRDPARPLDYTSAARGTAFGTPLDEAHLNENRGVYGTPANPSRNIVFGVDGKLTVAAAVDGRIDWNGKDGDKESDIPADINHIDSVSACSGDSPGQQLDGFDDWANIQYNPRLSTKYFADGARPDLPDELTRQDVLMMTQQADLKVTKSADQAEAAGGDTVTYTVAVTDLGPGTATGVSVTDTLPDGTRQERSLPDLAGGAVHTVAPKFTYEVPCDTADGTVLTNRVTVAGKDTDGVPDPYTVDNSAQATTTVRAPVLTAGAAATATVNAGEAITYTITYANSGGGAASNVTVTSTLPAGVYYSAALDQGAGPKPDTVTLNADGTRTLVWNPGTLPARSGDRKIVFTARPTLLATAGTAYTNKVSVSYRNAGGACDFAPVTDAATTTVTVVTPSRTPLLSTVWALRQDLRTAEVLARVQATDTRFDGADGSTPDGALSQREASAVLTLPVTQPRTLRAELLATTLNLGTRRINAGTEVDTLTLRRLHLDTVGDAVRYAQTTLTQPPGLGNLVRYTDTTLALTEINSGLAERY